MTEFNLEELDGKPTEFMLGFISGQLRELIHTMKNVQQSQEGLGLRMAKLEAAENRRLGATNILTLIARSPAIGWIAAAAAGIWAIVTGRVHA